MINDLAKWLRLGGDCIGGLFLLIGGGYAGYVLVADRSGSSPWITGLAVAIAGAFILAVGRGLSWVLIGGTRRA
ncbi:hypothetical protein [Hypericibacter sp.]|uniref:hypothetical protein n=1 Tax=Hypericibacter sp. TaxID=2705401 RepID=UPI003D6D5139